MKDAKGHGSDARGGGLQDVVKKHLLNIARSTVKMPAAMAGVMGGMTQADAHTFIQQHGSAADKAMAAEYAKIPDPSVPRSPQDIAAQHGISTDHLSSGGGGYKSPQERGYNLTVRNMNGTNEEQGYRLYWEHPTDNTAVPAHGLNTSSPFRTEGAAKAAGQSQFGVKAKRSKW